MSARSPLTRLATPRSSQRPGSFTDLVPLGVLAVASALLATSLFAALAGLSVSPLTWYLARSSGLVLYLLLWLSVVSGLAMTTKLLRLPVAREDGSHFALHQVTTELAFVVLALHLLSLAIDPAIELGMPGVLVPFVSDVRQPWTDLGIIAAYGLLAVGGSFALRARGRLGWRGWRLLHTLAFPLWIVALLHGIGAGTDSANPLVALFYLVTTAAVIFLTSYRLLRLGRRGSGPVAHPPQVRDRDRMRLRVEAYRQQCASLSSKTKSGSRS